MERVFLFRKCPVLPLFLGISQFMNGAAGSQTGSQRGWQTSHETSHERSCQPCNPKDYAGFRYHRCYPSRVGKGRQGQSYYAE